MPVRRLLVALAFALLVLSAASATAQEQGGVTPPIDTTSTNPCDDPFLHLECPDLRMAPPSNLHVVKAGRRLRLEAENRIVNVGAGPLELRANHFGNPRSDGYRFASATQVVRRSGGRPALFFPLAGYMYWKPIPGQGHYWKYYRAARFELWTLNPDGTRHTLQRTGPKLTYCFRDLKRVRDYARTPEQRVYPACSQTFGRKELRLGVSPGWADIYPATYHENWISITGLKGCFAFVHRADPLNDLIEEREDNNIGERVIRLPPRNGSVAPRGCRAPR
jgi:hypothetical protein